MPKPHHRVQNKFRLKSGNITSFGILKPQPSRNENSRKTFHQENYCELGVSAVFGEMFRSGTCVLHLSCSWKESWLLQLHVCLRFLFKTRLLIVSKRGQNPTRKRLEKRPHSFVMRRDNSDHVQVWKEKDKLSASTATCDALYFCFTNLSVILPKKETV